MRVYKFMNALHGISNLSLQRLRVSRFNDLNDPFELLAVDLIDTKNRRALLKFKQVVDAQHGLLCFSDSWKNPLLWGHYGGSHTGMALGFDVPDDLLFKVKYKQQRSKPEFNLRTGALIGGETFLEELIATKYSDWSYESEYRRLLKLNHCTNEGGSYWVNFSEDLALREMILGCRCELSPAKLMGFVKNNHERVWITKTKLALRKFALTEDREARIEIR